MSRKGTMRRTFELDVGDVLKRLAKPDMLGAVIESTVIDLGHFAEAEIKKHTPHVTGHARRSSQADLRAATRGTESEAIVRLSYPYAYWLETGEDKTRGRRMRSPQGGYRMVEQAHREAEKVAPKLLNAAAKEIAAKWGGR